MEDKLRKVLNDVEQAMIGIVVNGSKPSNDQMNIVRGIRKYFKIINKPL